VVSRDLARDGDNLAAVLVSVRCGTTFDISVWTLQQYWEACTRTADHTNARGHYSALLSTRLTESFLQLPILAGNATEVASRLGAAASARLPRQPGVKRR
jgi:hypothetical protein